MIEEEENDFLEINNNNYLKLNSNITSYSISAINDDTSTYMGVKSINEDVSSATNTTQNRKNKNKNKKMKKKQSFSSITESSHSESSNENKKSNKKKEIHKKESSNNNVKINKNNDVKTLFEWSEGGEIVYVTGSFCEWKEFYKMKKNEEGIFSLTLFLPRGFHQYKFKVDDIWEYSKNHPKFEDNGNVNNYIDTTDITYSLNENELEDNCNERSTNEKSEEREKSKEEINKKEKAKSGMKKKKKKEKKRYSSNHTVNFLNSQANYSSYYPLKSELNIKPSSLPSLYKTHFILNEDFKPKKERKFTKIEYINDSNNSEESSESSSPSSSSLSNSDPSLHSKISIFGEFIPYVKFQNLYHIHSNHLHTKMVKYKENNIISMTSRYRLKFSTFIYYKSNKPVEIKKRVKHSKTLKVKKK